MSLADVSIRRPIFISCLVILMLVLGVLSMARLGVDLFPDVTFPVVTVTTIYPGAGPAEMETLVAKVLEDEMSTVAGIKRLRLDEQGRRFHRRRRVHARDRRQVRRAADKRPGDFREAQASEGYQGAHHPPDRPGRSADIRAVAHRRSPAGEALRSRRRQHPPAHRAGEQRGTRRRCWAAENGRSGRARPGEAQVVRDLGRQVSTGLLPPGTMSRPARSKGQRRETIFRTLGEFKP